jgi:ABC-type uncharacterized transport system substrate-binding protein
LISLDNFNAIVDCESHRSSVSTSSANEEQKAKRSELLIDKSAEHGYEEGKNLTLVPSWGDGNLDRLAELAEALVAARVDLILTDGTATARAARAATTIIPIVMAGGNDPVLRYKVGW